MRLLIGEISSYKAIVIATFIKNHYPDCDLITYDTRFFTHKLRTSFSDKHYVLKAATTDILTIQLADICRQENITVFIPVNSDHITAFLTNRHLFGSCLNYIGPTEMYHTLNDKRLLYTLADELKIRIPELYKSYQNVNFPCVVKPADLSSSKGVRYFFNKNMFYKDVTEEMFETHITQEYIHGVGAGYSAFCLEGQVISGYGHCRLAEYPVSGGSSVLRAGFMHPQAERIACRLLEATSWSGFAMVEFKYNEMTNELVLIEVNPRIWGSINQGLQSGVNFFEGLLGKPLKPLNSKTEVYTYISPLIYKAMIRYSMEGNWAVVRTFLAKYAKQADVNWRTDWKGYSSSIARKLLQ